MTETLPQSQSDPSLLLGLGSQSAPEYTGAFDALREANAIAETQEIFQGDRLLARAVDAPMYSRHGLDFDVIDNEINLMNTDSGIRVSTTLLIPNESIRVYKAFGFLIDSDRTDIEHVAEKDSMSSIKEGQLRATNGNVSTLPELAQWIHETHTNDMNEVNITLPAEAVRGLFTIDAPRAKLDALVTQHHLKREGRGALPLFIYDRDKGSLEHWEPTSEEATELLESVRVEQIRMKYAEVLPDHDFSSIAQGAGAIAMANA